MLKYSMLLRWNKRSDPGLKDNLKDCVNFHTFVEWSFTHNTPDETTLVKFRQRPREGGIHDTTFDAALKHIEGKWAAVQARTDGERDVH